MPSHSQSGSSTHGPARDAIAFADTPAGPPVAGPLGMDALDRAILKWLLRDARKPFLEIARELRVSGGTIHQRVEKMRRTGIVTGYRASVDREKLGYPVTVLVGIHLKNARDSASVLESLNRFEEVLELHYTTGSYALIAKIATRSIQAFHSFLTDKLQALKEIQSTESFVCLASPTLREINP